MQHSSGWIIDRVHALGIELSKYQPIRGSTFIQLPSELRNKKAIVNVINRDQKCML